MGAHLPSAPVIKGGVANRKEVKRWTRDWMVIDFVVDAVVVVAAVDAVAA
jgi:hypothetical protein